jgi:hypothetical protein
MGGVIPWDRKGFLGRFEDGPEDSRDYFQSVSPFSFPFSSLPLLCFFAVAEFRVRQLTTFPNFCLVIAVTIIPGG